VVQDLLEEFHEPWVAELDLSTLERVKVTDDLR